MGSGGHHEQTEEQIKQREAYNQAESDEAYNWSRDRCGRATHDELVARVEQIHTQMDELTPKPLDVKRINRASKEELRDQVMAQGEQIRELRQPRGAGEPWGAKRLEEASPEDLTAKILEFQQLYLAKRIECAYVQRGYEMMADRKDYRGGPWDTERDVASMKKEELVSAYRVEAEQLRVDRGEATDRLDKFDSPTSKIAWHIVRLRDIAERLSKYDVDVHSLPDEASLDVPTASWYNIL